MVAGLGCWVLEGQSLRATGTGHGLQAAGGGNGASQFAQCALGVHSPEGKRRVRAPLACG